MQYSTTAGSCARDAGMNNCLGQILFLPQSPHDGQNSLQILLVHVLYGVHNLFRKDRIPVFGVLVEEIPRRDAEQVYKVQQLGHGRLEVTGDQIVNVILAVSHVVTELVFAFPIEHTQQWTKLLLV